MELKINPDYLRAQILDLTHRLNSIELFLGGSTRTFKRSAWCWLFHRLEYVIYQNQHILRCEKCNNAVFREFRRK